MRIRYFKTVWEDLRHSRGWFGRLCLIALLNFIPIFGQVVMLAYFFGWAREIAWGTHEPLPSKIIDNSDGHYWRRGWFVLLLIAVFEVVPVILYGIGQSLGTTEVVWTVFGPQEVVNPGMMVLHYLLIILGMLSGLALSIFSWIGSMRVSIYDRLSAGFQLRKIWKMFTHDSAGMLRIIGMALLVDCVLLMVLAVVAALLMAPILFAAAATLVNSGYSIWALQYLTESDQLTFVIQLLLSLGPLSIILFVVLAFLSNLVFSFVALLSFRAMGYWTMQFEVALWGGEDDPMPFELKEGVSRPQPGAAPRPIEPIGANRNDTTFKG